MMAYALEIEPALLPFAAELLSDFEELGSDSDTIVEALAAVNLPASATVLDLGCGKGAVAIAIAKAFDCQVIGVELMRPFIDSCRAAAQAAGLTHHCTFVCDNIVRFAEVTEPADAVVLAALGDVLGPLETTVRLLRKLVRAGGHLVIADAFIRDDGSRDFPGFEDYCSHDEVVRRLQVHGDSVVRVVLEPPDECEPREMLIRDRAASLAARHPEHAKALFAFADAQEAEARFLREHTVAAVWVVQRSSA